MNKPLNQPVSETTIEMNVVERLLECEYCRYTLLSTLAGARCGDCGQRLVTVIKRVELD